LILIDEISARFGLLALDKSFPDGQHAPTGPIAGLEHRHNCSETLQFNGSRQAGQTGSHNGDGPTSKQGFSEHFGTPRLFRDSH
jgi:hypothetical protein